MKCVDIKSRLKCHGDCDTAMTRCEARQGNINNHAHVTLFAADSDCTTRFLRVSNISNSLCENAPSRARQKDKLISTSAVNSCGSTSQIGWILSSSTYVLVRRLNSQPRLFFSGICGYHKILLEDAIITQAAQNAVTSVG